MSDASQSLEDELRNLERDNAYTTLSVLKHSPVETTEAVQDCAGNRFIRKYRTYEDGAFDPYRLLARVDDPAIPAVIDRYRIGDRSVVILQYFEGPTLRSYVESQGPLSESDAFSLTASLCVALDKIHSLTPNPLIHRDISPSNIIMHPTGPKLIDFGVAREFDPAASRDTKILGTVGYAAPEQFGFGQSGARTDVFALGRVLQFMLTGHDPDANTTSSTGISQRASQIIETCCALDSDNRFASARDVLDALKGSTDDVPATRNDNQSRPLQRKGPRAIWIWRALVIVVLGVFFCASISSASQLTVGAGDVDTLLTYIQYIGLFAFFILPIGLFAFFLNDFVKKRHWFSNRRLIKTVLAGIVCFAVTLVLVGVTDLLHSPDYTAAAKSTAQRSD